MSSSTGSKDFSYGNRGKEFQKLGRNLKNEKEIFGDNSIVEDTLSLEKKVPFSFSFSF